MAPITSPPTEEYPSACGGNFTDPGKHPFAEYKGKRIYFCTEACKRAYEKSPDDFMSGKISHPIEED